MIGWLLLLQAAAAPAEPPVNPLVALRGTVVEAIRNCGSSDGEIVACSRDRGYAEGQRRLQKLKKPKPVDSGAGVKLEVTAGVRPAGPGRE